MQEEIEDREESLEPQRFVETIDGKRYIGQEASAAAALDYQNRVRRALKLNSEGKPTGDGTGLNETVHYLVHRCMWETQENGDGEPAIKHQREGKDEKPVNVSEAKVAGWTHRRIVSLFKRIQRMSGLDNKSTLKDLESQRAELDKRIALLKDEAPGKNGEAGGMDASDFAES